MLAMSEIQVEYTGSPKDNDSIGFKGGYDVEKDPTASSSSLVSEGLRIRHGTLLAEELSLDEIIVDFVYDFETRHQVVLYKGGRVNVIRKNPARRRHFLTSNEPKFLIEEYQTVPNLRSILYIARYGFHAGITDTRLHLLDERFESTFEVESPKTLNNVAYNECSGEIVTFGPGYILTWLFRKAGKTLSPRAPITEGFSPTDCPTLVHFEQVPGKAQRCFSVVESGVRIHYLMSGELLASLNNLHSTPITCINYFRPLWYLVTGAKDGTICLWNSSWDLVASFVGHLGAVTSLATFPTGPYVMSSSVDTTVRVWNLETMDETERLVHDDSILQLHSIPEQMTFLSRSNHQIFFWKVQHVMSTFTVLWSTVQKLAITNHPRCPHRVVACCDDSTVRMVSPLNGRVLTTALLPMGVSVEDMIVLPAKGLLVLLCSDEVVRVLNTKANPCEVIHQWKKEEIGGCTCLGLYQSVMDEESMQQATAEDKWLSVTLEANELVPSYKQKSLEDLFQSTILVLVGTDSGQFGVLDVEKGSLTHVVRSHPGPIHTITCFEDNNHIVTTANDCEVSLWEIYPHAAEDALSEVMRFKADGVPSLVCRSSTRLCIAVNDHRSATYSVTMYNIEKRERYSQCTSMAHTHTITSLHCIEKLGLFLSGSEDSSVRIWDQDNHPIRIIQLTAPPEGVVFSSPQGDILLGNLGHIHHIPHTAYLTNAYQTLVVALSFPKPKTEEDIPFSVDLDILPPQDKERLLKPQKKPSQYSYRGGLSEEEQLMMKQAASDKARHVSRLKDREEELKKIRDGEFPPVKKRSGEIKGKGRKQMWRELMSLVLPFKRIELQFPEDTSIIKALFEEPYKKGPRRRFFPPLSSFDPPYPIAPDGVLPNSVILQKLRKSQKDLDLAKDWLPAGLSEDEIAALAARKKVVAEEVEEEDEEDNEFMKRMRSFMDQEFEESEEEFTPTPSPTPPPSPPHPVRTQMKVEKLITRPPPKSPTPPPPKTPTPPPRTPTPPPPKVATPPPTPLPTYISQFVGQNWFDHFFPNATSKTFPKPWSVSTFTTTILNCIPRSTDGDTKADVAEAVMLLHKQRDILWTESGKYAQMLFQFLLGPPVPLCKNQGDKKFVLSALKYLFAARFMSPRFVALLMSFAIGGEPDVIHLVMHYLKSHGLKDTHNYFTELLGSWDTVDTSQVYGSCCEWVREWAFRLDELKQKKSKRGKGPPVSKSSRPGTKTRSSEQEKLKDVSFETCDPIEVIHFYLEEEHKRRLAARKPPTPILAEDTTVEDGRPKNTILRLPRIQQYGGIIRLGETHCSRCHPERETSLALASSAVTNKLHTKYITEHVQLNRSWLTVPLKTQVIDPFGPEDEGDTQIDRVCRQLQDISSPSKPKSVEPVATWTPSTGYLKHYTSPLSLTKDSKYFVIDSTYVAPPT